MRKIGNKNLQNSNIQLQNSNKNVQKRKNDKNIQSQIHEIKKNAEIHLITINIKKQILKNFKNIDNYILGDHKKNTVLLIEPRFINETLYLLANTYNHLGNNWNYVFYCGKSSMTFWKSQLPNFIEIRALDIDNFDNTTLYSDFCKKKELWDSLYGEYVLTIQLDTWIMNLKPYDISYFINLNKSYIGRGLSLRKRNDMLKIIETYPPQQTLNDLTVFINEHEGECECEGEGEDDHAYFTTGCVNLNLPIGNDEDSSHFSLHSICNEKYFGIHKPSSIVKTQINTTNPFLNYLNKYLDL